MFIWRDERKNCSLVASENGYKILNVHFYLTAPCLPYL